MSIEPHSIPMELQVHLWEQGLLDDPDYIRDDAGRITPDAEKLKAYIEEHGEPPF